MKINYLLVIFISSLLFAMLLYIRNILHCKDLKRATAVINQSEYLEDCFPDSVNIKEDSLSFYAIVLEFNDGSVSRLMTTEDMYVESYKSVKDAGEFYDCL